ncbi:hypothetical protein ACRE_003540 [Hapsidospora chrysogenum ATCC 11550]|uniref:DUF2828 domain-containing protein n=1 Tax=Hapsidospora chrysogenum (strain ATCC 11550 / CBS 779.69 / DSM 880 / IAM 14645 / JCM 23072 / IMI 49137) TaxID=857340 RepID=A0A086THB6_HAPC1|nr:hypothetical protein ACRE_003540 [Hapsidospora chrysogenum ATCC 11550]
MASTENNEVPWFLQLSYPVLFPSHEALTKPRAEFDAFIRDDLARRHDADVSSKTTTDVPPGTTAETVTSESFTEVAPSTTGDIRDAVQAMDIDEAAQQEPSDYAKVQGPAEHPFMEGLLSHDSKPQEPPSMENKMLTENADLAHQSTTNPLVDLFAELEDVITPPRLRELLEAAWSHDPQSTLRIIFNARSIHLGKSSKHIFYHCAGWLAQNHPLTLVANLQWLSRPVIPKKEKKDDAEDNDVVLVEADKNEDDPARYDVKHGVAHGYWKDLLNILALAANGKLDCLSDPRDILNSENPGIEKGKSLRFRKKKTKRGRNMAAARQALSRGVAQSNVAAEDTTPEEKPTQGVASEAENPEAESAAKRSLTWQEKRLEVRTNRHQAAVKAFEENHVFRALHLTVARLFAEQLEADLKALRGDDPKARRTISLCAKWAPSQARFHDRHTFVVSSIAEIMYPRESLDGVLSATDSRETYLRHARERYRKDVSALRKHLEIVERDITAQTFSNIKYDRVPSVAMRNYSKLFAEKDFDRFEEYISRVAEGKANISGATLLPSTLVHQASQFNGVENVTEQQKRSMSTAALLAHKKNELQSRVIDGQWKTLVQRIKDSGTLSSAIAVCDVSGSMTYPRFKDGTCPLDSSIGLSLLVASCTAPPFGGAFITFSATPAVEKIDLSASLTEQICQMQKSDWQMNTNFAAVFEKLILPMAEKNNLKPEDMVKRVFVFSDMQFDSAEDSRSSNWSSRNRGGAGSPRWRTSYERIKRRFEETGYEMPELVFWNLAGGRDGMAPKPVTTMNEGTSLVSGYSQGMLKVFLDSGGFEEPEEEDESDAVMVEKGGGDGEEAAIQPVAKKSRMDPLQTVKRAIGHKSYEMLKVLD